jgi:hypothetical protein
VSLWKHLITWLDWHGRISALVALIIAFGGAALINRVGAIWGSVHGVYLWIVSLLAFGVFLATFEIVVRMNRQVPSDSMKAVAVPIAATDPRIVMEFETKPLPFNARNDWIGERPVILRNDGGEVAYDVRVEPVIFKHGRAQFATVPTLSRKEATLIRPEILDFPKEITGVSEFEVLIQQAWMAEGDWRQIEKPMRITYRDFGNRRFATDFVLSYDLKSGTSAGAPKFTRLP